MKNKSARPVFLNLFQIKLPPAGLVSVAHRISGFLLVLSAPIFIYLFAKSLHSAEDYQLVLEYFDCTLFKVFLLLMCWSVVHHLLAGIRFLLLDIDICIERDVANKTAWVVMAGGVFLSVLLFVGWL
jgi:succinate dehydrogenase / fumarate reductase, cytochrome b subunit